MKPAILAQRLRPVLPHLICPQCGAAFALTDQSLICQNGHCFDLSRRGYVNLAPSHRQSAEKYDAALFESRGRILADGFYAPVLEAVCGLLELRRRILPPRAKKVRARAERAAERAARPQRYVARH